MHGPVLHRRSLSVALGILMAVGCSGDAFSEDVSDTSAPTVPTGVSAVTVSSSRIDVSWSAASDDVGVAGYLVYRDGGRIADVAGTTYSDSGLSPATTYTYTVAAYDTAGNVSGESAGASATTEADAGTGRGALTFDAANPRWLVYEDGTPFFMVAAGGPEYFLYDGTRQSDGTRSGGRQQAIIDAAITHGWNGVYMMVDASADTPGAHPWLDYGDPGGAEKWNPDIIDQWHGWFAQMDEAGIVIFLFLYDDGADPFGGSTMSAAERSFIDDLVAELKPYDHLVWVIAEEYDAGGGVGTRAGEIAARIRATDAVHPVANHQNVDELTFDYAGNSDFHQFAIQTSSPTGDPNIDPDDIHADIVTAWGNAAGRYNLNGSELQPDHGYPGEEARTRQVNWATIMGGAYVMVLRWWDDVRSDGNPTPSATEQAQAGYARQFMANTRFDLMAPDDRRAAGDTEWVLAHRADLGNTYFIGYGRSVSAGIGFTGMDAGTYALTWLDTATGETVSEQQTVPAAGRFTFAKPAAISGSEVALYARKTQP